MIRNRLATNCEGEDRNRIEVAKVARRFVVVSQKLFDSGSHLWRHRQGFIEPAIPLTPLNGEGGIEQGLNLFPFLCCHCLAPSEMPSKPYPCERPVPLCCPLVNTKHGPYLGERQPPEELQLDEASHPRLFPGQLLQQFVDIQDIV